MKHDLANLGRIDENSSGQYRCADVIMVTTIHDYADLDELRDDGLEVQAI